MMSEIEKWKDAPLWTPKKIKKATKVWFKFMKKVKMKNNYLKKIISIKTLSKIFKKLS